MKRRGRPPKAVPTQRKQVTKKTGARLLHSPARAHRSLTEAAAPSGNLQHERSAPSGSGGTEEESSEDDVSQVFPVYQKQSVVSSVL